MDPHTARAKLESIRLLWIDACRYSLLHEAAQRVTITRHKRISSGTLVLAFITTVAALAAGALEDMAQAVAFGFNLVGALATSVSKLIEERADAPNKAALHAKDKHTLRNLCNEIDSLALQIIQAVHGRRALAVADVDAAMAQLRVKVGEAEPRAELDDGSAAERANEEVDRSSILRGLDEVQAMLLPKLEPPLIALGDGLEPQAPPAQAEASQLAAAGGEAPAPPVDAEARRKRADQDQDAAPPAEREGTWVGSVGSRPKSLDAAASKRAAATRGEASLSTLPERAAGVVPVQRRGRSS